MIGKIEKGERFPSLALARRPDAALDTGGALARLWPQLEHERATRDATGDAPASGDRSDAGDLGLGWSATPEATARRRVARSTLLHYVKQVVLPLLKGSYNDTIGRELMAAARP